MKLYHVFAVWDRYAEAVYGAGVQVPHVLVSYAEMQGKGGVARGKEFFGWLREQGAESIFLDSGAFTAANLGREVRLDEYQEAVAQLEPDVYAQLDVIGDPGGTKENLARHVADGFDPLPVFTRGAPFADLHELAERYDHICLGGLVPLKKRRKVLTRHVVDCFHQVGRKRFHGFGVSAVDVLMAVPLFSADSSGLIQAAAHAAVMDHRGSAVKRLNYPHRDRGSHWRFPHLSDRVTGQKRYQARAAHNAAEMNRMAERVTKVWAGRGIEW